MYLEANSFHKNKIPLFSKHCLGDENLDCTKLQTLERYHKIKNITGLWKWILRTESDDQNSSSKTKF